MQPALIFDFGNVLAFFDYKKAAERLGEGIGLSGADLLARAHGLGFDGLVKRYEAGKMTSAEFSREVSNLVGLRLSHDDFAAAWADIFELNEPVAGLVADLKRAGYTLVLGSNTNDLHAAQFRSQFADALSHFDRLVLSYEVGHIKPSADFYHACADAAGRPVAECVFIDDLTENIEGARAAGLTGIVYRDTPSLVEELAMLGILPA
ncbi:HAD family phosphatase [Isosphaeraceae bacterium EP7]